MSPARPPEGAHSEAEGTSANGAVKHKAVATWLALLVGVFGLHRFYLHGLKDAWGWMFPLPTLLGIVGLQRMDQLGQDDRLAWLLIPLLGVSLVAALLSGIRP